MPDRNVTPSTTDSSQHNRPENGTELLPDRLAEIRARLDAMKVAEPVPGYPGVLRMSSQMRDLYAADIAYLLAEVEAWRNHCGCCDCQRLRGGEVIGCICEKCKRYKQEQADA
jgi:hypothetical protein